MKRTLCCFIISGVAAVAATVAGRVTDSPTGEVIPATVAIRTSNGKIIADHPSYRGGFRSPGTFEKEVPAGDTTITVTRGFDYIPIVRTFTLGEDERRTETFALRRRSPLRAEGWYTGDHHAHMIHGERNTMVDFEYIALAARAEALDFLSVAQFWNLRRVTPEELERAMKAVSTPDFTLTWNLEAPKNYLRGNVSHCLGHGWTLGMRGRTRDGRDAITELLDLSAHDYESEKPPYANFESHALIHSLGGIVSYSHPVRWGWGWGKWGGKGIYPVEEKKFVSNMAQELPFDTVCGPTYDTIDILMQPQERDANREALKLWFLLLNMGYHLPASGSSDATFDNPGRGVPGRVRVYAKLDGKPHLPDLVAAVKAGRSFVTTGPLLVLDIGGYGSGETVILPARGKKGVMRAWADRLSRIELFRNGTLLRTFDVPAGQDEFTARFDVDETERAWYVARCYGADDMHVAVTNPVWFEQRGWKPPAPARAHVNVSVLDKDTGKPLDGTVEVIRMVGREEVVQGRNPFLGGKATLDVPGTVRMRARVTGYKAATRSIFLDHQPLLQVALDMRAEHLTDARTFEKIAELLKSVKLEFALERE